ncbi:unnamed protein product, partial [Didymodactylos carnosus]
LIVFYLLINFLKQINIEEKPELSDKIEFVTIDPNTQHINKNDVPGDLLWNKQLYDKWISSSVLIRKQHDKLSGSNRTTIFDISVMVITGRIHHRKRSDIIMSTWGGHQIPYGNLHFISDSDDNLLPILQVMNETADYWKSQRKWILGKQTEGLEHSV